MIASRVGPDASGARRSCCAMLSQPARKRFGQHFLVDSGVIDSIVRAIDPRAGERIVEIGPGRGALTEPLRASGAQLTLIELDRDLAAHWRKVPGIELLQADVLRVDFARLAIEGSQPLRVVGNLPYNISTPILFHLLAAASHLVDQHVMLQKEVVDRIAAAPGGRDYGRLSVMLQWRYEIERLFDVPAAAFEPAPRVTSGVLRMTPLAAPPRVDAALLSRDRHGLVLAATQAAAPHAWALARAQRPRRGIRRSAPRGRGDRAGVRRTWLSK